MGKEIEIKAKIDNINKILSWLSSNAIFDRVVYQEDILYDYTPKSFILDKTNLKADEFMRIRRTDQKDILTHKIIRRDSTGNFLYCDETETIININNYENIYNILSPFGISKLSNNECKDAITVGTIMEKNNFKELIRITKKRKEYHIKEFNIAVDEVSNLGDFIEIESLQNVSDEALIHLIKNKEIELLKDMQISLENIVEKGYLDLIMEHKNGRII